MKRAIVIYFAVCILGCRKTADTILIAHASFSQSRFDDSLFVTDMMNVMRTPNVICQVREMPNAEFSGWRKFAIAPERHDRLVEPVDNTDLVDRYQVDAREPGSARECIEGTSMCYDPGIGLLAGSLSRLGDAYVLYIPPEADVAWTDETTQMVDTFSAVFDECLTSGAPFEF